MAWKSRLWHHLYWKNFPMRMMTVSRLGRFGRLEPRMAPYISDEMLDRDSLKEKEWIYDKARTITTWIERLE